MIVLFTDFGVTGPYVGQLQAVLYREAPGIPIVELLSNAPTFDPRASAYLLAAYVDEFPNDTVFLCAVDPGVGGTRRAVVVQADERWFVGPDNGLFNVVSMRARNLAWWEITWRPNRLSASFHGRDLFAPVAARLTRKEPPPGQLLDNTDCVDISWPKDWPKCIYVDDFGNVMTGIRAAELDNNIQLEVNGHVLQRACTFSDMPVGQAFWYQNANGLMEIAVNQGHAAQQLGIKLGDSVSLR
jgi:S-adenosylmethionine hydrolase